MPAIFNEENREPTRQKILENGYELMKRYGVKRMTVADIARASGLAKGTFYTFFPSKEEFIYQIILRNRVRVKEKYTEMVVCYGSIGREALLEFFSFMRNEDVNTYRYMTEQDIKYLTVRWPQEYSFNPKADEATTKWLLGHMRGLREGINWKVLANFTKTIALMEMSQGTFHEDALAETWDVYRNGVLDYLFGPADA